MSDPDQRDTRELAANEPADGVGDECDPRPTLTGDYIAFVRMHEAAASNPYDYLYGTATWAEDALELGTVSGAGQADFMLPALPTRLEIQAHVVTIADSGTLWFGLWYHDNPVDNPKAFAEVRQELGGGSVEIALKESKVPGPDRYSTSLTGPAAFEPGQQFNLIVETGLVTGGDDRLTVVDGDGQKRSTTLASLIEPQRRGFLEANLMVVAFDHFIAYAIR